MKSHNENTHHEHVVQEEEHFVRNSAHARINAQTERIRRLVVSRIIKDIILLSTGVASAVFGLKGFLLPNGFLDGGVTGIALLVKSKTNIDFSILIALINIPFIIIGIRQVSMQFAIKTACAIVALATAVHVLEFPIITSDKLLIAVFGGFFLGAGIGLSIRGGGVIDGTEVMAIYVSRRSSLTVGDVIAGFNICLFGVAAVMLNIETALYSILTYFSASKTVDFLINGIEEYIGVTIVSDAAEDVKLAITHKLGRGVTVYRGEGGFGKRNNLHIEKQILFCVVTRLEVTKLLLEVEKIDMNAFVIQHSIKETRGGIIKKRPLH